MTLSRIQKVIHQVPHQILPVTLGWNRLTLVTLRTFQKTNRLLSSSGNTTGPRNGGAASKANLQGVSGALSASVKEGVTSTNGEDELLASDATTSPTTPKHFCPDAMSGGASQGQGRKAESPVECSNLQQKEWAGEATLLSEEKDPDFGSSSFSWKGFWIGFLESGGTWTRVSSNSLF